MANNFSQKPAGDMVSAVGYQLTPKDWKSLSIQVKDVTGTAITYPIFVGVQEIKIDEVVKYTKNKGLGIFPVSKTLESYECTASIKMTTKAIDRILQAMFGAASVATGKIFNLAPFDLNIVTFDKGFDSNDGASADKNTIITLRGCTFDQYSLDLKQGDTESYTTINLDPSTMDISFGN